MAAKIRAAKGVDVDLVKGGRGAFEVFEGDKVVYSKLALGRFPNSDDEVIAALG